MSIFKKLTEKPGELLEINRLNKQISAEEEKVQVAFLTMGKFIFEAQGKGEPIPPELVEHCEKVKATRAKMENLRVQVLKLRDKKQCPQCGTELELAQPFCSKCGGKQEMPREASSGEAAKRKCGSCGAELTPTQVFCSSCGGKQEPPAEPKPAEGTKKCASCGTDLAPGQTFCSGCGAKQ
ncbi:MAG: zinc ribbon domain-containing protein [Coprothermobacterota bacterium]|nr:zinc ribbon domain-containing protein [Coprothermobacterota bacterium]